MEEPGALQSMGLLRVGHDWGTELNWTEVLIKKKKILSFSFPLFFYTILQPQSEKIWFGTSALALNPEMICYLSKRQRMILSAKTLYSISLFHPLSSPGDRFTVLHGFIERKHYYLYLLSSHLLLKKKWFEVRQKENRNLHALSIFLSPDMVRFIRTEGSSRKISR